jgi:Flp pilus assembly protein TadG
VKRPGSRGALGQTLVEFALVFPIFILVLCGLIDMGRAVYSNNTLAQAAREATRLAATQAFWVASADPACNATAGPVCPATVEALKTNVDEAANRMAVGLGTLATSQIYIQCNLASSPPTGAWTGASCDNRHSGDLVSVRITYTFSMLTPIVGQLADNLSMSASATMLVN